MRIIIKAVYEWDGFHYIKTAEKWFDYFGPVELACGASAAQNQIGQSQQNFATQLQTQATSVFGNASSVFNNLMSSLQPTVAAGPSQQGFSPQELSNLNSEAITQSGQSYQNEKAAVGNAMSAEGGGNSALPSGAQVGANLGLAENAGNQTASELAGITQANYAQGNANYNTALTGEQNATNVYGQATNAAGAANTGSENAANTANQITQANAAPYNAIIGALGGVAGVATGGLSNMLMGGLQGGGASASMLSGLNTPGNAGIANYNQGSYAGAPGQVDMSGMNPSGTAGVPGY